MTADELYEAAKEGRRVWDPVDECWRSVDVSITAVPPGEPTTIYVFPIGKRCLLDKPFTWGITREQAIALAGTTTPLWVLPSGDVAHGPFQLFGNNAHHFVHLCGNGSTEVDGWLIDRLSLTDPGEAS